MTSSAAISNPTVVDFSQFAGSDHFSAGPVQIGNLVGENITWESTSNGSVIGDGDYGLIANGLWTSERVGYSDTNSTTAAVTHRFLDGRSLAWVD